jgi:C1A family cysteine protease
MKSHLSRLAAALAVASVFILAAAPVLADKTEDEEIAQINKRNAERGYHWTAGRTSVSGLSAEEKKKLLGALPPPDELWKNTEPMTAAPGAAFPPMFDWRQHNGVTPVTDQKTCGSCWAFAAVAQLESHTLIYDLRLEDLSEQQVVDCDAYGGGCGGGYVAAAYELFMDPGCVAESCYPYEARDDRACRQNSCAVLARIATYVPVDNDVDAIKAALANGPVTCLFSVVNDFFSYTGGCYDTDTLAAINHAILIIGWDESECAGQGSWIIKNSWNAGWGMDGFAYVKYGTCRVGSYAYQIQYLPSPVVVCVTSPNGGEIWKAGDQHTITWYTARQTPDSMSVLLSLDGGETYEYTIAHGLTGATSYDWTVPELPVSTARVKVVAYYENQVGGYDVSNGNFRIKGEPQRYVSTTGEDRFPYSVPAWAARDIQDAVDVGEPGDTINVAVGAYYKSAKVETPLYLLGGWNADFTERSPELYPTTVMGTGSLITFMNVPAGLCGIEGFNLRKGSGTYVPLPNTGTYGGAVLSYQSSPLIMHNAIDSCGVASVLNFSGGGAIACYGGAARIEDNDIIGCSAQCGGGIYLYESAATIRNNRIIGCKPNAEYNGAKHGGGIYAYHAAAALEGNRIEDNDGYRRGAGIYLSQSSGELERDTIIANDGLETGGGICAERSSLALSNVIVRQNSSGNSGGGIYQRAGSSSISNCLVALNHSSLIGGGVYADSCWGAFTSNTFDRNYAKYGGGNIYLAAMPSLNVWNNLVTYGVKNGFQATNMTNVSFKFNNCFGNTPLNTVTPVAVDATNTSRNPRYADTLSFDYHLLVHSGGIDTGDPAGTNDPDGSRADQGAFGGPDALMAAPPYVENLAAAPGPDTLSSDIYLIWSEITGDVAYYAVYTDTITGFAPDESVCIDSVGAPACSLLVSAGTGKRYYRVSAVNASGYGGGYSNQVSSYAWDVVPPTVSVTYPNGGEALETGDTIRIDWIAADNHRVDSVSIYYSENAGRDYTLIEHGWRADSSYAWIVPSSLSDSCLVKVVAFDPGCLEGCDTSDSLFSIKDYTDVHDEGDGGGKDTPRHVTALEQNYPNPFNGTTTIFYSIGERCDVDLGIYDAAGHAIRVLERTGRAAGRYSVLWNGKDDAGRDVATGVYFCRIKAGKYRETRKVLYLR